MPDELLSLLVWFAIVGDHAEALVAADSPTRALQLLEEWGGVEWIAAEQVERPALPAAEGVYAVFIE
jgi:uncharacterized protein YmfQ (DUF2313 family)